MNAKSLSQLCRPGGKEARSSILLFSDKLCVFIENTGEDFVIRALRRRIHFHISPASPSCVTYQLWSVSTRENVNEHNHQIERRNEKEGEEKVFLFSITQVCWPETHCHETRDSWDCNIYWHINLDGITRSQMSHKPAIDPLSSS